MQTNTHHNNIYQHIYLSPYFFKNHFLIFHIMIKSYPSVLLYLIVIILSIRIIIRSNNWFFIWIGFEISIFGFLPLFSITSFTTEAIIKYFLIQAGGSVLFLISFIYVQMNLNNLINLRLTIKLGIFPFFQWIPLVIRSLSWKGCIILTTFQKIRPLVSLALFFNFSLIIFFRVLGIVIRRVIALNQTSIRPLIAYSSISHTRWICLTIPFNLKLFIAYIASYFIINFFIFSIFDKNNTNIVYERKINKKRLVSQYFSLLILTGFPPFFFFFLKINILFIILNYPRIVILLLLSIYLRTYYYLSFIIPRIIETTKQKDNYLIVIIILQLTPLLLCI